MKLLVVALGTMWVLAFPAKAAIVTYDILFFDGDGAQIGTGAFSFDDEVFIDLDDFCDASCRFIAGDTDFPEYNPLIDLVVDVDGYTSTPSLERFGWGFGQPVTVCIPNDRNCVDTPGIAPGFIVSNFGGTFALNPDLSFLFAGNSRFIEGTYELIQTPLPGAAILFLAGGAFFLRRRN